MSLIYLDNAATTVMLDAVSEAIRECYAANYANPSSQHAEGRRARARLEDAREEVIDVLGASSDSQLLFTSGGTEANNTAVLGLAGSTPGRVVISKIEHPSVLAAGVALEAQGFDVQWIPAHSSGVIDLDFALQAITPNTKLVSVMAGNHETGVLQPVEEIAHRCADLAVPMHVDAVQCIGKSNVDFANMGIAAMTVAPHKFHGPRGIAGLLLRSDCQVKPLLLGGSQQFGLRPGTEDVALAVGFSTALRCARDRFDSNVQHLTSVRDEFESSICNGTADYAITGHTVPRLPHISNVAFRGLSREALLMNLDLLGVACSTGSACTSGSSEPSPVLQAMHLPDDVIQGALRFSFSRETTSTDCHLAAAHIFKSINNLEAGYYHT